MKVFRVIGTTGEYDDSIEWTAKCFFEEDKALAFVEECKTFADWLMEADEDAYPRYYNIEDYREISPDKHIMVDYTGTYYQIEELEIED